ncbi:hypothetical protein Dimus_016180 [Dionaea muscipula]
MDTVCGLCGDRDLRWICEDSSLITPATAPVAPRRSERLRVMPLKVEKIEIAEPKKDKEKDSRRFKIKKKAKINLALRRSERLKEIRIKLETET